MNSLSALFKKNKLNKGFRELGNRKEEVKTYKTEKEGLVRTTEVHLDEK